MELILIDISKSMSIQLGRLLENIFIIVFQ